MGGTFLSGVRRPGARHSSLPRFLVVNSTLVASHAEPLVI
jgi:hypothetical protein